MVMITPEFTPQQVGAGAFEADQPFFVRNSQPLQEILEYGRAPTEVVASLDDPEALAEDREAVRALVNHTQRWAKGDHSKPEHALNIDPVHTNRLHELYVDVGMRNEVLLAPGHYDTVLVPGAVQRGNVRRVDLLRRSVDLVDGIGRPLVAVDEAVLLGGQRHMWELEKEDFEETLILLDGVDDPWLDYIREVKDISKLWETDGLRLAAMAKLMPLVLQQVVLRPEEERIIIKDGFQSEVDPLQGYVFTYKSMVVSLMHTLAVPRANGDPRHTTEACVEDWLLRHNPPVGAHIGFIAANPHLERMVRATRRLLTRLGRSDLKLIAAGSAAPDPLGHGHFYGETARNLYEDWLDLDYGNLKAHTKDWTKG
jgi:hypothetical protein